MWRHWNAYMLLVGVFNGMATLKTVFLQFWEIISHYYLSFIPFLLPDCLLDKHWKIWLLSRWPFFFLLHHAVLWGISWAPSLLTLQLRPSCVGADLQLLCWYGFLLGSFFQGCISVSGPVGFPFLQHGIPFSVYFQICYLWWVSVTLEREGFLCVLRPSFWN